MLKTILISHTSASRWEDRYRWGEGGIINDELWRSRELIKSTATTLTILNLFHYKDFILENSVNEEAFNIIFINGESFSNDVDYFNGSEKSYVLSRYRFELRRITYNLSCGYSCLIYHSYIIRVSKSTLDEFQGFKASLSQVF